MPISYFTDANMTPEEQWDERLLEAQKRYELKMLKKRKASQSSKKPKKQPSTDAQEWIKRQKIELEKLRSSKPQGLFSVSEPWKNPK